MKCCTKCGETKALDAFTKDAARKDGRFPQCRSCTAGYRQANSDAVKRRAASWRAKNVEREQAYRRAYDAQNATVIRDKKAAYRALHTEIERARSAAYRHANRPRRRAYNAAWVAANPEKNKAKTAVRRARERAVECDPAATLPAVINRDGRACYICGTETDSAAPPRARHKAVLEHVIPLASGGAHVMGNLRCACHPCNQVKGHRLTAEQVREMFT